jgi:hypothetical protein
MTTHQEAWLAFDAAVKAYAHGDTDDLANKRMVHDAAFAYVASRGGNTMPRPESRAPTSVNSGAVFPPYGRSKGAPVAGASVNDLEFYRNGCLRTLADESKSRWHDKERELAAVIRAEMAR